MTAARKLGHATGMIPACGSKSPHYGAEQQNSLAGPTSHSSGRALHRSSALAKTIRTDHEELAQCKLQRAPGWYAGVEVCVYPHATGLSVTGVFCECATCKMTSDVGSDSAPTTAMCCRLTPCNLRNNNAAGREIIPYAG